jgi:peroxiredoxin (alkyl hydroperoxide reductase subunit C)
MKTYSYFLMLAAGLIVCASMPALAASDALKDGIYQVGTLKPVDSTLKVKVGEMAPDFTLRSVSGGTISIKDYRGKKNVMISFVPAAWTPVCSDQWPGYNIAQEEFERLNTALVGITEDNIPTLYAWTKTMGALWFPVLSDFWPHGKAASAYGVLRSDGTAERAIFIIDRQGIIRYLDVHDINTRPPLEGIINELEKLNK